MESRILNLSEALKLYKLLSPYLPHGDTMLITEYISEIFSKLLDGKPHDYISVIELMTGVSEEQLREKETIEILNTFIEGLTKNRIIYLKSFCEIVIYG